MESNRDYSEEDARYFDLVFELQAKHSSRYEEQTELLLRRKLIATEFSGAIIEFRVTPLGCSFRTLQTSSPRSTDSWLRMGWSKSAKRKALPLFFAQAEASALVDSEK